MIKKITSIVLLILICLTTVSCEQSSKNGFDAWDKGSYSLFVLTSYIDDITNSRSANYIPEEDRIAIFDMDGTLCGEKAPIYFEWAMFAYRVLDDLKYKDKASKEEIKVAKKVRTAGQTGKIPPELEKEEWTQGAKAFAGMTLGQYNDYVSDFLDKDAVGFRGLKYSEMWYEPMLEVVYYLQKNNFTIYICSGTDRMICRRMLSDVIDMPFANIIGSDIHYCISGQEGKNQMDYQYEEGDKIVRTDNLINKNVKFTKVESIINYIGKKPVLSFGNSSGDTSMAKYVTEDNDYQAMAYMVVADDDVREFGNKEKASVTFRKWDELGMVSFSMKHDFKKIYRDNLGKNQ